MESPVTKAVVSVFPPLLIYGTLVLGSPVTLQVLVGASLDC